MKDTGIVTIFRESSTSVMKSFSGGNQWPGRTHRKYTLDGEPLIDLHGKEFASFRVPAGRHLVELRPAIVSVNFELHPGERIFIRPGIASGAAVRADVITITSCDQAVAFGQAGHPEPAKHVQHTGHLSEASFPTSCDEKP